MAIGELADGLEIDLDAVRKKYDGLDGTELAISESQERMAVVVAPEDTEALIAAAERENLEAYPVAVVTEAPRMVMHWKGQKIADLSREFLNTNGAVKHASVSVGQKDRSAFGQESFKTLREMASSLKCASRRGLRRIVLSECLHRTDVGILLRNRAEILTPVFFQRKDIFGGVLTAKIQIEQNRVMSFFSERLIDHGACDERHITLRTDTACQNYYFHIL